MHWNPDILAKFVAPGIADFTYADIPDISEQFPQSPHWVVNHFLNNALLLLCYRNSAALSEGYGYFGRNHWKVF
jgi:hypothetical protein